MNEICQEESFVIRRMCQHLLNEKSYNLSSNDISVLTPYRAQRNHLQLVLNDMQLKHVATVDEFQGLQNKVIIVSLVHRGERGPSEFMLSE